MRHRTRKPLLIGTALALASGSLAWVAADPATANGPSDPVLTSDAYVSEASPTQNYGQDTTLQIDSGTGASKYAFLKFDLSDPFLDTATLHSATLKFHTGAGAGAGSAGTFNARLVANDTWTENGLTWNNKPTAGATVIGTRTGLTVADKNYKMPLDVSTVAGQFADGTMSLRLATTSTDGATLESQEDAVAPTLVLTFDYTNNVIGDAYTDSGASGSNFGTGDAVLIDGSGTAPTQRGWLKFDLSNLSAGDTVTRALLQIKTYNGGAAGSADAKKIRSLGATTFTESTITDTNKPTVPTTAIGTIPANTLSNTTYTVPLDAKTVTKRVGSTLNLEIDGKGTDALKFNSRENAAGGAKLLLTVRKQNVETPLTPYGDDPNITGTDDFYTSKVKDYSGTSDAPQDSALTTSFRSFMAAKNHPDGDPDGGSSTIDWLRLKGWDKNASIFGQPFFRADCEDPIWKVVPYTGFGGWSSHDPSFPSEWQFLADVGLHVPADAIAFTNSSDSPMVIQDTCGDTNDAQSPSIAGGFTAMFTKAFKGDPVVSPNTIGLNPNGTVGGFYHTSNGLNYNAPGTNQTANVTSRGRIPDAMAVRNDLMGQALARGWASGDFDLGHVLHLFFVETCTDTTLTCYPGSNDSEPEKIFPMTGDENDMHGWGGEGTRIAVDPTIDLNARRPTAEGGTGACKTDQALVIANTLQKYGAIIGDNAGGTTTTNLHLEQENDAGSVWDGTMAEDTMQGCLTWTDFVVIQEGWPH